MIIKTMGERLRNKVYENAILLDASHEIYMDQPLKDSIGKDAQSLYMSGECTYICIIKWYFHSFKALTDVCYYQFSWGSKHEMERTWWIYKKEI